MAIMEFRVLGPVELWSAGRQEDLGPARARSVLAMLLLSPGAIVPVESLIDRLWDTNPPPKARESLSVYIARLRAALRQAVGDSVQLMGRARGYVLEVDPETVDVHQFRRLRRQAAALAAADDHGQAAMALREADGLWHGQALAGIGGDWVARMRDSLEEERRAAIFERVGFELELGRHSDLVGELRHLLAQYPLDETLVAHQMTALYRSGRPADALGLYRETRDHLVEEQGTEPGPVLAELHQRILAADPTLTLRRRDQHPDQAAPPDTLPPEASEFVGRHTELGLLTGDRGSAPGVAIIEGMPGVGKTALAVRTARSVSGRYPDGTFYINLHSGDPGSDPLDPAEALHRLLRMMSVPVTQMPDTIGDRVALWKAQLSRRRAIVILDNATGHDQIRPLLPATGQCLILVTSRRRLAGLGDVRTLTLDVLDPGDATRLFRQIAGEDRTRDTDQVSKAVEACGRLPLAIALAASRVAHDARLNLADLVEELSQSPAWLGGTSGACPEVMSAFDLSYQALEADHQRFFRRLGASPCDSVSLEAAAALTGCTLAEAEKALVTLLDYHLLTRTPGGQFRFHDLIRGYAALRAGRDDPEAEQRQALGRLLDYYLYTADWADRILRPFRRHTPVQVTQVPAASPALGTGEGATGWLELEWRNILAAARYAGRHEWKRKCADLTHLLADFLEVSAYWDEAVPAHTLALQASRDLDDPARVARASLALCTVRQQTGRHDAARQLAEEAASIYRSLSDPGGEAQAIDQLGLTYQRTARSREALAYFREARLLYLEAGDQRGVGDALSHSGIASWHLGRYPEATAHLRDALSLYRGAGDRRGEAKTLNNLGRIHLYRGYHRDALDAYQQSLEIFREIGGAQNEAILYHNIGGVHLYKGSFEEALAACRRALAIYRSIGDLPDEADVLNDMGDIYQSAACYDEALVHHQKARLIAEEIGDLSQQLIALRKVADIYRCSGQYDEAFGHYDTALRLAREVGDPYEEGKILEGIAESTLSTQQPAAARIVFLQALDIFERLGVPEAEAARIRIETIDPAFGLRLTKSAS
ncbi:MAG TPA: tetratricopeptide repeat protein [Streptosporangiaceae bacterium]|nr:tetratricopeptide repeat protein [Streptosporangiaceae bacterium]